MSALRPISDPEYETWLAAAQSGYAEDKVRSGAWPRESALELSRNEYASLLPQGTRTPDHFLYAVVDDRGARVGTLWFAIQARGGARIAYVYDIEILAEHRRQGHARRAFAELEREAGRRGLSGIALHVFGHNEAARALYAKLGFAPTNINLFKAVPAARA